MKKIINEWKYSFTFSFDDDLISFYTFFTIVLSEIAFLWAFMPISQACYDTIDVKQNIYKK